MGAAERRFAVAVWIDGLLLEHVILFVLLTVPETTQSCLLFVLHALHTFTFLLGKSARNYPGNAMILRPLLALTCVNLVLDAIAVVGHAMVAVRVDGRLFCNQVIFAVVALAFVANDLMIMTVSPKIDDMSRPVPPGPVRDLTAALGSRGAPKHH